MPDKEVFEYAFIRFVPRVEREEFINVGVILLCKRKKFLGVKIHLDKNRLKAFAPTTDLEELTAYLKSWEAICEGNPQGGKIGTFDLAGRFRWLTASRSTILQHSKVHPGNCDDPAAVLDKLFTKYVL